MTEPGRIRDHAQAAGCATVEDYAATLENALEAIVIADRGGQYVDPEDWAGVILDARELVDSWDIRP